MFDIWEIYAHTSAPIKLDIYGIFAKFGGIFVSETYLGVTDEVEVGAVFGGGFICKNVGSIYLFSNLVI